MSNKKNVMCLFDVDGTLTKPRLTIAPELIKFLLEKLRTVSTIGLIGGSDINKIAEQMTGHKVLQQFDYVFSENGLLAFKSGEEIGRKSIQTHIGEEKLQKFINFTLKSLSEIELPVKRGTFIEFRTGMLNVSPIGRACSREERNNFEIYDKTYNVRKNLIATLKTQFPDYDLTYSIGGQISIDVFPKGWDKTYCLKYLTQNEKFSEIHFFGDKTEIGGNDYEIFSHENTIGHKVSSPEDTEQQIKEIFNL